MTTDDSGTIPDAEPLAAATDLGTALRELIEVSVTTTVAAGEVRAAAELVRQVTERLAVARRPASQLPALDDLVDRPPGLQPGDRRRQRAGPAAGRPPRRTDGVVGGGDPRPGLRGPAQLRARRHERAAHGPAARLRGRGRGSLGHDRPPGARLPRPAAAGDAAGAAARGGRERGPQVRDHRHDRPGRRPRQGPRRGARRVRPAPPGEGRGLLRRRSPTPPAGTPRRAGRATPPRSTQD